jgi:hypothetical protein
MSLISPNFPPKFFIKVISWKSTTKKKKEEEEEEEGLGFIHELLICCSEEGFRV